ncbi:MAG: hypothetical protein AB7P49_10605, partial [Bdellovibrionales bacterium]
RKKSRCVFWARLVSGAIVLFPLSLTRVDFRASFASRLSVAADKSSPACAAFIDLREDYNADIPNIPEPTRLLSPSQPLDPQVLLSHVQGEPKPRQITLAGTTIRVEPPRLKMGIEPVLAQSTPRTTPLIVGSDLVEQHGDLLAMPEPRPMRVADYARELAQKELQASTTSPVQQVIRSQTGTSIIVRGESKLPSRSELPILAANEPPRTESREEVNPNPVYQTPMDTIHPSREQLRPLWLKGHVEMTGGLAYVGPETQIMVKRVHDGEVYEHGRIWVSEGKFEIHVKKALGYLVAELRTRNGQVLGRGDMNLVDLHNIDHKDNRIDGIRLALRPTTEVASFHIISGESYDQHKLPVRNARMEIQAYNDPRTVDDDGILTEPGLAQDSSFVVRASAKKHWSTLVVGQAKRAQDVRLFSNSLVEALINLHTTGTDRKEALQSGVVWGRITRSGTPVAGASVEMAGEYEPVYFNEAYIPDRGLKATSQNGMFAFLKVKAGVQALRVKSGHKLYPAQVFPTEGKHVSYVELEVRDNVISQFKVIDILDVRKPLAAQVRLVGTDEVLSLTGNDMVRYGVSADPFMVEADAGTDYEISRVTLTGSPQLVHIPMLRRDWIYSLHNHKQLDLRQGRGIVVGFVDDVTFEADITGRQTDEKLDIVYFDAQGQPLESGPAPAGGGFAIFNAPTGLQTVFIQPATPGTATTFSQIVVPEPGFVHVMSWSPTRSEM